MRITIEPDLSTSVDYFFAFPYKTFKNQSHSTEYLKIPLQQREYDWGNDPNNIEGLLEDLDYHLNFGTGNYFAGTILLENQNSNFLKVIDGQQRLTTIYLFNFLGYLISRYRVEHLPTIPNVVHYALEFKDRFDCFIKFEKRIFLSSFSDSINSLINDEGTGESNQELLKRLGRNKNADVDYWSQIMPRLQFDDSEINSNFLKTLKEAFIAEINSEIEIKSHKGLYFDGTTKILNYLKENCNQGPFSIDLYLKELLLRIEKYISICGLAAIISENSDDSFRLFEILNDRGQDLTALDLIKNIILERCNKQNLQIQNFTKEWKKLKENVRKSFSKGKADSMFVENIIRSEGSNLKNKEISYLNNKIANERQTIFINEPIIYFFQRLLISSSILKELNDNIIINKSNNTTPFNRFPMTCFQYATFMRMINYNWGPQIILSSNLQYLASSRYSHFINNGTNPDWKNNSSNNNPTDLNHFTRFLGDITLKLGLLGIVNGLATKELPTASRQIANLIINNVENNPQNFNSSQNLNNLKAQIIAYLNTDIFTQKNNSLFETRLSDTFVASTGQKKNIVKILLYFIYNKGGVVHNFNFPELEHLEPSRPLQGAFPYYNGADREELINRLGNFALIEKNINIVDFSNKPLIEKIRIATTDPKFTSFLIFQNDTFLNLNFNYPKTYSPIYGDMPMINKAATNNEPDASFDINGTPTKHFFEIRSKFLASIAKKIVCNTSRFLDDTANY